jgi:hypothetical protein
MRWRKKVGEKPIEIVLKGKATTEQNETYRNLPFEVPDGIARIDVRYQHSGGIQPVDIGIFDSRGSQFMTEGARGWSGSARRNFFIARDEATPGYMPGPIQPGTWSICMGFPQVRSDLDYTVTVKLTPGQGERLDGHFPALLPLSPTPNGAVARPDGWYKGDFHCHSVYSDGDSQPEEVIAKAKALGFDFLALTDHNVLSHQAALLHQETDLILIPGYEVTTYKGHWNIWGDKGWIDFRVHTREQMESAVEEAIRRGYLVSCNHPRGNSAGWQFEGIHTHCLEIWNRPWPYGNSGALALWEERLKEGQSWVAVGGSDSHFHKRAHEAQLGQPTTYVHCEEAPSAQRLLDNLRAGHAFITEAADGPQLYFGSGDQIMGDTVTRPADGPLDVWVRAVDAEGIALELHGAQGCLHRCDIEPGDRRVELTLSVGDSPYLRAQLVRPGSNPPVVRTITNPIYLR